MPSRCPTCSQPYDGSPSTCPSCGARLRSEPGRCEFCRTRIKPGQDTCPNCGAPVDPIPEEKAGEGNGSFEITTGSGSTISSTTITTTAPKSVGCGVKGLIAVIVVAAILPILLGIAIPAISHYSEQRKLAGATPEERGAVFTPAPMPDSIYTAVIAEGENTIETIWPRVMTDLPDSVAWVNDYNPAAAFAFSTTGSHSLIQLQASAPNDLVMSLLRRNSDGSLTFLRFNDDGSLGRDPSIIEAVSAGDYLAIVNDLGGYEYGEVRFVWEILQPEIAFLEPDTAFTITLSDRNRLAYFFVNIEADSSYVFEASSEDIDSYIELRTAGGSVLSDDDSGTGSNWNDARLAFDASALNVGEACLIVRPYYYSTSNTWGDMRITYTRGTPPDGGGK